MTNMLYFFGGFIVGTVLLVMLGQLLNLIDRAKRRRKIHLGRDLKIDEGFPELTDIDIDDINN